MRRRTRRPAAGGRRLIRGRRANIGRLAAAAVAVPLGIAAGLELADGELMALGVAIACGWLLLAVVPRVMPLGDRRWLALAVLFAFAVRLAVAVVLRDASLALGHDGTVTGDDHDYFRTAGILAENVRGTAEPSCVPPTWCGDSYLLGTFVYVEALVFIVFGKQLLIMLTLNAALGASLVILASRLADRIWRGRYAKPTAIAVAVYPGLILFSALNIKEPMTAALTMAALLIVAGYQIRPRWWAIVSLVVVLEPLHSLRQYVFVALAAVAPVAAAVTATPFARKVLRTAVRPPIFVGLLAISVGLIALNSLATNSVLLTDRPLDALEYVRTAMSRGRTGFAQTPVPSASGAAGPVVVVTTTPTMIPTFAPTTVPEGPISLEPSPDSLVLSRTLNYFPRGLLYVLLAPFPWVVERLIDLLVIPDTVMWYILLACALWSVSRARRQWRSVVPPTFFAVGMLVLFALFEGNVGTLYRHRAVTVVPIVAVLAGPGLVALADGVVARWRRIASTRS